MERGKKLGLELTIEEIRKGKENER